MLKQDRFARTRSSAPLSSYDILFDTQQVQKTLSSACRRGARRRGAVAMGTAARPHGSTEACTSVKFSGPCSTDRVTGDGLEVLVLAVVHERKTVRPSEVPDQIVRLAVRPVQRRLYHRLRFQEAPSNRCRSP